MWIMSESGFVSVVEYRHDATKLLVRARVADDLMSLVRGDKSAIEVNDQADYMYRAVVSRDDFVEWMSNQIKAIWYTSHAKEAMTGGGADEARYRAYLKVWTAMFDALDERSTR